MSQRNPTFPSLKLPALAAAATAAVAAALALAAPASAAPVVRQASGAAAADIDDAVELYREDLGEPNNMGAPGPFDSGRREINWDAVPAVVSEPNAFPGDFFNGDAAPRARGAVFANSGNQFSVSGGGEGGEPIRFSSLNPSYPTAFGSFSPEKLFAPIGSTDTDVDFFVPGTATPASSTGFGAVFTDVDNAGTTKIELFDDYGRRLGSWDAPPFDGDGGYSFLGISFDEGETVGLARITTGDGELEASGSPDDVTQGGEDDLVALDDFLYGEPQQSPQLLRKPKLNKDRGTAKLRALVPGAGEIELRKSKKLKRSVEEPEEAGPVTLSIKPKGAAKEKLEDTGRAKVKVKVTYTPTGGEPSNESKKVKLKQR
jgi:hypothetical protein